MTRTVLVPATHSAPIGAYTPGIAVDAAGQLVVHLTGQVANDPQGRVVGTGDIRRQTEQVFDNLRAVLAESGGSLADLVAVTIYLTDRALFDGFNEVRNRVLADGTAPTSTVVFVSGLVVPEHLVEISGIAVVGRKEPEAL